MPPMVTPLRARLCAIAMTLLTAQAAYAQAPGPAGPGRPSGPPPNSLTIGLGAGVSNRFIGSDSFAPQPFPSIEYRFGGGRVLRTSQFGFELDMTKSGPFDYGPIVRINTGRDDFQSADDPVIEALGQVSAAPEVGAFMSITKPLILGPQGRPKVLWTARAEVTQAINGHDGMIIQGSAGLIKPSRTWTFIANAGFSFATDSYQDAFFSVDDAGALASGLERFEADTGFRDVGLTGVASYRLSPKWSVTSVLNYSRLVGDAANSPVVTERGSPNQFLFGLNVAYKFF